MARFHYWQYLINVEGQPIPDANISIYLAGTDTPANIYFDEFGSSHSNEAPQIITNNLGYFEFWIGDSSEEIGYNKGQKFKLEWEKTGVALGSIDWIDVFPHVEEVDETDSLSSTKNKVISNKLAFRWEKHRNHTLQDDGFPIHGIEAVNETDTNTFPNKLISNKMSKEWSDHTNYSFSNTIPASASPHGLQIIDGSTEDTTFNKLMSNKTLFDIKQSISNIQDTIIDVGNAGNIYIHHDINNIWELQHNFGVKYVSVTTFGYDDKEIKPISVELVDMNNVRLVFEEPVAGYAVITGAVVEGGPEIPPFEIIGDHGSLTGLLGDDHTIYSLADGSRPFTGTVGGINPSLPEHLTTKSYVDYEIANIVINHSRIANSSVGDDHNQYIHIDGRRGFINPIKGEYPIEFNHLTTKEYVDSHVGTAISSIVTSHSNLTHLDNDDHLQYIHVDGRRGFTNSISGIIPSLPEHLTTKEYVDNKTWLSNNITDFNNSVETKVKSDLNAGIHKNITVNTSINNQISFNVDTATNTTLGVASFDSDDFDVNTGAVSIKDQSITVDYLAHDIDATGIGFNADKVDGRNVMDSSSSTNDLWTAAKIINYVNQFSVGLDWQDSVLDKDLNAPPTSPTSGDRYLVSYPAAAATGDWIGHDNQIAQYNGSTWDYTPVSEGMAIWIEDENTIYTYNGTAWVKMSSTQQHNNSAGLQGGNGTDEFYHLTDAEHTDLTDGGDTILHYHLTDRNRTNHTGTQTASTISDFDTEVSNNVNVVSNTAKNTYPSNDQIKVNYITVTHSVNLDTMKSDIIINNAKISFDSISSTKLGTIEDGAEVNNISDINAIDLTDGGNSTLHYHASDRNLNNATGVLPTDATHGTKGGGNLHSNATETVNGFMSSIDKTKLDSIESGATADQTAVEILTAIKTVDGSGSGLDADKLDGHDSSYFATSTQGATANNALQNIVEDTTPQLGGNLDANGYNIGSNSDANITDAVNKKHNHSNKAILDGTQQSFTNTLKTKLDGIENGATADQTASEIKSSYESNNNTNAFTDADSIKLNGIESGATADQTAVEIKTAYENNSNTNAFTDTLKTKLDGIENNATSDQTATEILTAIKTVDGSGSGLNADKLDGHDSSYFLSATGETDPIFNASEAANFVSGDKNKLDSALQIETDPIASAALTIHETDTTNPHSVTKTQIGLGNVDNISDANKPVSIATQIALNDKLDNILYTANDILSKIKTVDGSGSGLDADKLDGYDSSQFLKSDDQTWVIETSNFSAVINKKYIVDTTSNVITATLPATANNGESIKFVDGNNFSINNLIIKRNGNTIGSLSEDMIIDIKYYSLELVFYNNNWVF